MRNAIFTTPDESESVSPAMEGGGFVLEMDGLVVRDCVIEGAEEVVVVVVFVVVVGTLVVEDAFHLVGGSQFELT